MSESELPYWLAVNRISSLTLKRTLRLRQHFGSLQAFFSANKKDWLDVKIKPALIEKLLKFSWSDINKDLKWGQVGNHHILSYDSKQYPAFLKEISSPPPILYIRGDTTLLSHPQIAMVGSRRASPRGIKHANRFASELAKYGWCITSGLAKGIDSESHRAALLCKRPTIAVMGTACDRIYPSTHQRLAKEISEKGAIVSEFPLGYPTRPENFPRRNRIISGLSAGVLVIEASKKSGSLITAHQACEQGREVFVIPGLIEDPLKEGCHRLINQGAKLVSSVEDIIEELPPLIQSDPTVKLELDKTYPNMELSKNEESLLDCFNHETLTRDMIIAKSGLTPAEVSSMLSMLEVKGIIKSDIGGYTRIH